ncbi:phenol degradation protein meta [Bradyrhizobium canariense]|uniref:SphA family protein n=1 Tax=Bradyrhizobium canariense TaxID=255045 RepID=UPI001CA51909|nr:transporter [Bradyrhizobium canariense]MBW5435779.1 phenol degradation protein meta [Bradyrhizobium canariense]
MRIQHTTKLCNYLKKVAFGIVGLSAMGAGPVPAAEGNIFGGPIGGTDIRNAYLPPAPGLYLGLADLPGGASQLDGPNGKPLPGSTFNFKYNITAGFLLYEFPSQVFGGSLASTMQFAYVQQLAYLNLPPVNRTEAKEGWLDIYTDVLKWSKHVGSFGAPEGRAENGRPFGLTIAPAFSMILPTGTYDPTALATPGKNVTFIIPNIAFTYLTRPLLPIGYATEFDAHFFYDKALKNPFTNYQTGDVVSLDFAVSQLIGHWQVGVAGGYGKQITDDYKNGVLVQPDGKRLGVMKLGPVIAYDIPQLPLTLKLKYLTSLSQQNLPNTNTFVLTLATKLF